MKYLPFFILAGCSSQWDRELHYYDDEGYWCEDAPGETYEVFVMDSEIPEVIEQGEIVDLVWHLDTQTYDDNVRPCFRLNLYDLEERAYIEDLGLWIQPASGLIHDQIHDAGYYLIYPFRGYQSGQIGLEIFADQVRLDRTTLTVE